VPGTLTLEVVTPERSVCRETISTVTLPGQAGYLGVLPHHAPLVTALKPGLLSYRTPQGDRRVLALSGGFAEIADNNVLVLADAAERPEEIDVERALAARRRAEERLRETGGDGDVARARIALQRALARLKAVGVHGE